MTALNPVFTIGDQIAETLLVHGRATRREARDTARSSCSTRCAFPTPRVARRRLSAPAVRRHAAARADRDGAGLPAVAGHRRRADDGARRHDPGADPRPAARDEDGVRPVAAAHHARSRRHRRNGRPRRRHVRGAHRRDRPGARDLPRARSIRTRAGCWRRCPAARRASGCAPSTARCRCSARCRPAARSTRAVPIDSSRARPRRRRTTPSAPSRRRSATCTIRACAIAEPANPQVRIRHPILMPLVEVSHLVKHFTRDGGLFRARHARRARWTT